MNMTPEKEDGKINQKQLTFINKATMIHGGLYDYSLTQYTKSNKKVIIICNIHGQFHQTPDKHINAKTGCPKCAVNARKITNIAKYGGQPACSSIVQEKTKQTCLKKYGVERFINKPKSIQTCLEKYGTTNPLGNTIVRAKRAQTMLALYGVEHPIQNLEIKNKILETNINKYGKHHHYQRHITADGLEKLNNLEVLLYYYHECKYPTCYIANILGVDRSTLVKHLHMLDIDIAYSSGYSHECINWLDLISEQEGIYIQHALNGGEYQLPGTKLRADGYCKETNTIYEFHGDYWHGNPEIYPPDFINEVTGKSMGELYQKTIEREELITSMGYHIVSQWRYNFLLMIQRKNND